MLGNEYGKPLPFIYWPDLYLASVTGDLVTHHQVKLKHHILAEMLANKCKMLQ